MGDGWTTELTRAFRVEPGRTVDLARDYDPAWRNDLDKDDGKRLLQEGIDELSALQERLAAQDTVGVLVVLQALDAAGKDGTIRHVMSGLNPQGVVVRPFKVPSEEELDHDFLWRYQRHLPERGQIGIFNRSHYEEVLVVRVHPELLDRQRLPPGARADGIWHRRYRQINDWERYLTENGFRIVKLLLNVSREEQRRRFLRRLDLPDHTWKFSAADVRERAHWDEYQRAFSEMLSHTSTEWAPWHVVPADRKWFLRLGAAAVVADALRTVDPHVPRVPDDCRAELEAARRELEAEAPPGEPADPFDDP